MTFTWLHPDLPPSLHQRGPARLEADEIGEAEYRARLYYSLGFSLEEAKRRVLQNLRWEWELHRAPGYHRRVVDAVEKIYAYNARSGGQARGGTAAKPKKR